MIIEETSALTDSQKQVAFTLWNNEYPAKLEMKSMQDMEDYLRTLANPAHYFLKDDEGQTEGWAFTFTRENDTWFAISIDEKVHGQGKGKLLLNKLKEKNESLNGWVIDHNNDVRRDGEIYYSPVGFYLKNGFEVFWDERLELPVMSAARMRWTRDK